MPDQQKTGYYTFLVVFFLAIFSIAHWFERHQALPLMLAYTSAFVAYIFLLQKHENTKVLIPAGILVRLLLFFHLPSLSDDLYRFIWDGMLLKNGIHPFNELPSYYLGKGIEGIDRQLFDRLNSPNYFTIYPPLNQLIFLLGAWVSDGEWLVAANMMRLILFGADIGSFYLLRKLLVHYSKPSKMAFWYFLNPLVILEFTGNLHFEGLVILFLLMGIYGYETNKNGLSAIGFGLAIGTKLLPLIYLPYLFFKGLKNKKWMIPILAGIVGLLSLLPILNSTVMEGMAKSLDLYFRSFEFNASIYFIARAVGFWLYGYNNIAVIGPLLSIFSLLAILTISLVGVAKKWPTPKTFLFILSTYLAFATTVHPWYILPLVAMGLLSGYWYPLIWSFLIFLTYSGYTQHGYWLPGYIIFGEYMLVGMALWVDLKYKPSKPPDKR